MKFTVTATWDDAPHLSETVKKELYASIPAYQLDARTKGIPQLGSGAIYPVPETEITVPRFDIPKHWRRGFGLDVGWKRTAVIWVAQDPETRIQYAYDEHYMSKEEPSLHAAAIRARGVWIPGVIDPAARGRSQADGSQLIQSYRDLGLDIEPSLNAVEAGLSQVWDAFSSGLLKVFPHLTNFFQEFRLYRRDENGKVVKKNDHLLDALRYFWLSGRDRQMKEPVPAAPETRVIGVDRFGTSPDLGWMGN